ncbi:MAG: hypothetical protein WCK98_00035 [bacterium]
MPKNEVIAKKFITPEGSSYILFPAGYTGDFLKDLFYFKNILLEKQTLRVLFDKDTFGQNILSALEQLSLDLNLTVNTQDYKTNFFKINPARINIFSKGPQSWDNYSSAFDFHLIKAGELENLVILKDFMLSSFASQVVVENDRKVLVPIEVKQQKVINGFELSISDKKIKNYLIFDTDKIPVAAFSLVYLENEIQLQSVAGRSSFKTSTTVGKLSLVMSVVYKIITSLEQVKNLTFTSSKPKVVQLYLNLGCTKSADRGGFVVSCHT